MGARTRAAARRLAAGRQRKVCMQVGRSVGRIAILNWPGRVVGGPRIGRSLAYPEMRRSLGPVEGAGVRAGVRHGRRQAGSRRYLSANSEARVFAGDTGQAISPSLHPGEAWYPASQAARTAGCKLCRCCCCCCCYVLPCSHLRLINNPQAATRRDCLQASLLYGAKRWPHGLRGCEVGLYLAGP